MANLRVVFLGLLTVTLSVGAASGSTVATADSLYFAQEWTEAAALYEEIVAVDPEDAESAYRLALSHHLAGDFAKAIPAHRAATRHRQNRVNGLYNLACAHAQLGDVDLALEALQGSLEAGFQDNNLVLQDTELDPIRDEPGFQEILRRLFGDGYTGFGGPGPTPEEMRQGIRILVDTICERHPDPYRHYAPEAWDARAAAAIARTDGLDETGYYVEVRELAGMVGDVHTSAFPRRGSHVLRHVFPLRLWEFADGLHVRAAAPSQERLVGARVLEIGGVPVDEAWDAVMSRMSTENPSMSTYMAQVHLQFPAYLHALGLAASDSTGHWTFLRRDGVRETVRLVATDTSGYLASLGTSIGFEAPMGWIQGHDRAAAPPRWLEKRDTFYWYEHLDGADAVFMQLNIPRNHGAPWRAFLDEMFGIIRERDDVQRLVIDLRHNEGGWSYMYQDLVHHIVATPKINRPGHLFVLTSRITQSAGVAIAARLDVSTNALFVGEPAGAHPNFFNGPMGNHPSLALPGSNIMFRVSTVLEQNSDPLDDRCFIAPDLPASMTYEDYAAGRDPVLEAPLEFPPEEGARLLSDHGGRPLEVYFQWRRPDQKEALERHDHLAGR